MCIRLVDCRTPVLSLVWGTFCNTTCCCNVHVTCQQIVCHFLCVRITGTTCCDCCSCLELLLVGSVMVSLNSILDSEKDMFATTILQCFLQSALQDREESRVDSETAHFSKKAVVEVFKLRLRDKTCAVRVMALQVCTHCPIHSCSIYHDSCSTYQ